MKLRFVNPGFEYSIESISGRQAGDIQPEWADALLACYPQLDRNAAERMDPEEFGRYAADTLALDKDSLMAAADGRLPEYTKHWETHRTLIEDVFSDAFLLDFREKADDMTCRVTLDPAGKRDLAAGAFDVCWRNSARGMLALSVHEIGHILWFRVWHEMFGDDWAEYEKPSIQWIFSEIAMEFLLSDRRLKGLEPSPLITLEPLVAALRLRDRRVLKDLESMYWSQDIRSFMGSGYEYCREREGEIRRRILGMEEAADYEDEDDGT